MSFEFETKEQREAWPILKPLLPRNFSRGESLGHIESQLDEAADRFDEREKTCGIEPLSPKHAALILVDTGFIGTNFDEDAPDQTGLLSLRDNGLIQKNGSIWKLTDKGREILANLNAMCKVTA